MVEDEIVFVSLVQYTWKKTKKNDDSNLRKKESLGKLYST